MTRYMWQVTCDRWHVTGDTMAHTHKQKNMATWPRGAESVKSILHSCPYIESSRIFFVVTLISHHSGFKDNYASSPVFLEFWRLPNFLETNWPFTAVLFSGFSGLENWRLPTLSWDKFKTCCLGWWQLIYMKWEYF